MTKINLFAIEMFLAALVFSSPVTNEANDVNINGHGTLFSETGEDSTNNQNGFNEDSFNKLGALQSQAGLRGQAVAVPRFGSFRSPMMASPMMAAPMMAAPMQGAAPAPIAFGGMPVMVMPQGSNAAGNGFSNGNVKDIDNRSGILNGDIEILSTLVSLEHNPEIKLRASEEAVLEEAVIEEERFA